MWKWRQFLESLEHEENSFVTLTYEPAQEPPGASLEPRDLQLFIKRIRKAISPRKVRFFGVGEYRGINHGPHYHLSLFGVQGDTVVDGGARPEVFAQVVERCWPKGFVLVAELNEHTVAYVTGYVTKAMTRSDDRRLNDGQKPEFARMSRRPGIGAAVAGRIAKALAGNADAVADVPQHLGVGRQKVPLGRYLKSKAREAMGYSAEYVQELKDAASMEKSLEVLALFESGGGLTARQSYVESIAGRIDQVEKRYAIWISKRGLR